MKNIYLTVSLILLSLPFAKAQDKNFTIYTYPLVEVNSKDAKVEELAPVISEDGKHLFFVRWKDPQNKGENKKQDIWYAKKQGKSWSEPINLGSTINNEDHNVVCGTNKHGTVIYLSNEYIYNKKGNFLGMRPGLSYSVKRGCDTCWSKPTNIKIKGLERFNTNYESGATFHYHRTENGGLILFSALEKDENGLEENIFVCFQSDKSPDIYENIIKLGENINNIDGVRRETAPFLSNDGQKIYFTSIKENRDVELYVSKRKVYDPYAQIEANWTSAWSEAKPVYEQYNFVDKIHHNSFEAYLFLHKENNPEHDVDDYGFLAMDSPANIYEFNFLRHHTLNIETYLLEDGVEVPLEMDYLVLKDENATMFQPKSDKSGNEVQNTFRYVFLRQPDTLNVPRIALDREVSSLIVDTKKAPKTFQIEAEKENYSFLRGEKTWQITDEKFFGDQHTDVVKLYFEKYTKPDFASFMITINFDWDSARIRTMEHEILDELVDFLNDYEKIQLSIYGHTDNTGKTSKNDTLSLKRVNSTFEALKAKGLSKIDNTNRVKKVPYGENALKNPTTTEVKDEANRRAEIVIKNFPAEAQTEITALCNRIKNIRVRKGKRFLNDKDCLRVEEYNESQRAKSVAEE